MKDDPTVEEIRRVRSAHAARCGNDLDRIFAAIKESEKKYTAKLVNREPILQSLSVPTIKAQISTKEIVDCIREGRER
jgi:hypothetical protein